MEQSFIAWAKQRASRLPVVKLGIGDDAALLQADERDTVVTCDSLCDGTHFMLKECGPRAVGRKLAGVNLSDLAAMGAEPIAFFLSVCLPREAHHLPDGYSTSRLAVEIFEGVCEYAERFQVAIAGGDTNVWSGPLAVHLTAVGKVVDGQVWKRSTAKPTDLVVVTGDLGGSLLGRHLNVEPRLSVARKLRQLLPVHAATDISDGLGIDLLSLFSASRCGAELYLDRVPISEAARQMAINTGKTPLQHALEDGEDFELLLAIPASAREQIPEAIDEVKLTVIGQFISRTGLWGREGSQVRQLPPKGYSH